jgi:hypothetical protein
MVEESDAQLVGAAEGTQGGASGLSRIVDHSCRDWRLFFNDKEIGSGKYPYPSVEDAMMYKAMMED